MTTHEVQKHERYQFELNAVEIKNLEKFKAEVPARHRREHCLEISFKYTGIGMGVTAKIGAYSKDITDYSRW
jgi:hypothetical protein